MTEREPVEVTNLDRYGFAALRWSRVRDQLAAGSKGPGTTFFLSTVRPDGRPHSAGVGAVWLDGDLYFTAGAQTRKARNLASNPACTISVKLDGIDVVFEGEARRLTDAPTLHRVAQVYQDSGWPAEVSQDAFTASYSAPSAGPPPWQVYRFTVETAFGVASAEPPGATRWRF
ncbi:MAG TPA: pyridoxamine 5'-phosphate oxidase family protein [Micromonosporaceae bacterium]